MTEKNRRFLLKSRPQGRPSQDNFDYTEGPLPKLGAQQALVRNLLLSIDPTNRIWMSDADQYMAPVKIGEVMRGGGIGVVVESNLPKYKKGDYVTGLIGWQDYMLVDEKEEIPLTVLPQIPGLSLEAAMSVIGMTGLTAYFGLLDIGQPKAGETLVVSAAAGAVGSLVGQIGKIKGLRVVGIAGSEEKCAWLTGELGFDAAINYKKSDWKAKLKEACPNGVDINFENVGGEIMNTVISMFNLNARMVLCGMISGYNAADFSNSTANLAPILMKRARIEGFIILDYASRYAEASLALAQWAAKGQIKHRETVVDGLENAPAALNKLFDGENIGKLMVRITDNN